LYPQNLGPMTWTLTITPPRTTWWWWLWWCRGGETRVARLKLKENGLPIKGMWHARERPPSRRRFAEHRVLLNSTTQRRLIIICNTTRVRSQRPLTEHKHRVWATNLNLLHMRYRQ
jgi:hypothetical protein